MMYNVYQRVIERIYRCYQFKKTVYVLGIHIHTHLIGIFQKKKLICVVYSCWKRACILGDVPTQFILFLWKGTQDKWVRYNIAYNVNIAHYTTWNAAIFYTQLRN